MAYSKEFREFLVDVLSPVGNVTAKRMFSGFGVFYRDVMFLLCIDDVVYLKVGDSNLASFEEYGCEPFSYMRKNIRRSMKSYYQVPDFVLDDETELLSWARRSIDEALIADQAKVKSKHRNG